MRARPASLAAKNAVVFALALAGSMPYGCLAAASLACGAGIQIMSVFGLERSVRHLAAAAALGGQPAVRPLLFLRFAAVAALLALALATLPLQLGPFVVGLSTVIPAALWHGIEAAQRGTAEDR
jgi:hypothetical protein